jgi:CBS domain-containing protein
MMTSATVQQYMSVSAITLTADMAILDAGRVLVTKQISGAPVIDEKGLVIGMLTAADCLKTTIHAGYFAEPGGRVAEFMSVDIKSVAPEMSILDLAELFLNKPYRRYPVIENSRLIGIISRRDVLRALLDLA